MIKINHHLQVMLNKFTFFICEQLMIKNKPQTFNSCALRGGRNPQTYAHKEQNVSHEISVDNERYE